MNCCRTAALRIFVTSIARVAVPVPVTARGRLHGTLLTRTTLPSATALAKASSRTLHTSCTRYIDTERAEDKVKAEADSTPRQPRGEPVADTVASPAADGKSNTTDSPTSEKKKKKQRWRDRVAMGEDPAREAAERAVQRDARQAVANKPRAKKQTVKRHIDEQQPEGHSSDGAVVSDKSTQSIRSALANEDDEQESREKPLWRIQKEALKQKFPDGWNPRKKLSPDAMAGIRALNAQFPETYTTAELAKQFEVSPEAIRRILRSKWTPSAEEELERKERWFNRGKQVWARWAELGKKPPVKWRQEGIVRDPKWNKPRRASSQEDE